MMNKNLRYGFVSILAVASLTACGVQEGEVKTEGPNHESTTAVNGAKLAGENSGFKMVDIYNSEKERIGQAHLAQTPQGVMIKLKVSKLSPGVHGFHIHETGKCEGPDFSSAGGHFNPTGKEHGFKNPKGYHAGDLPNVKVGQEGLLSTSVIAKDITLEKGKPNSLFDEDGSALIIHERADDYKTDPAGNAGNRVACAVIK